MSKILHEICDAVVLTHLVAFPQSECEAEQADSGVMRGVV